MYSAASTCTVLLEEQRSCTQHTTSYKCTISHNTHRFPLQHYTWDVYVASDTDAVRLIDFNPIGGTTAPLLFTWEELGLEQVAAGRQGEDEAGGFRAERDTEDALHGGQGGNNGTQHEGNGNTQHGNGAPRISKEAALGPAALGPANDVHNGCTTPNHKDDSSSSSSSEIPVRLIVDPIGIQPNKVAYMVPFDFVDDGPGGAAEGLWERLGALEVHK